MLDIYEETKALLLDLEAARAEYALCGAMALAVHGVPRFTSDIDLLVERASVEQVIAIAKRRGFVFGAAPMGFQDGVEVHRWSKVAGAEVLTLDLLVTSPSYQHVWDTRVRASLEDHSISVVSRDGLIQMKLGAGRPKDIIDVQALRELDR